MFVVHKYRYRAKFDHLEFEEAGLKLLRKPVAPKPRPRSVTVRNPYNIKDWEVFLTSS